MKVFSPDVTLTGEQESVKALLLVCSAGLQYGGYLDVLKGLRAGKVGIVNALANYTGENEFVRVRKFFAHADGKTESSYKKHLDGCRLFYTLRTAAPGALLLINKAMWMR